MRAVSSSSFASLMALVSLAGCPSPSDCSDVPCIDSDGDGFCADCCPGRPCDCDDDDPLVHPGARDAFVDGYDFDCDGTDLGGDGAPCDGDGDCSGRCNPDTATCTSHHELCDGSDADGDGRSGCLDRDCAPQCDALVAKACAAASLIEGSIAGSFSGAPPLVASCGLPPPQRFHRIVPGVAGEKGELHLTFSGLSSLELRSECEIPSLPGCIDTAQGAETLVVTGGLPLFVIAGGTAGYSLGYTFTPAICGDGVVTAPESCDDGALVGGDGCDADCQLEAGFDLCALASDTPLGITVGSTIGGSSISHGSCGGEEAPERVHRIVPPVSGTLQLALESEAPLLLQVRGHDCSGLELSCLASGVVNLPVVAEEPIIVIVDGASAGIAGSYTLIAHLAGS